MTMPREDGINTRNICECEGCIFLGHKRRLPLNPCMRECNHDISALVADLGHKGAGCGLDRAADHPVFKVKVIPMRDLGRQKPNDAYAQAVHLARFVAQGAFKHEILGNQGFIVLWSLPQSPNCIGASYREYGRGKGRKQPINSEVELVISKPNRIISKRIHGFDCGMGADPATIGLTGCVNKWRALQEITRVEQQAVLGLAPRLPNKRSRAGQPGARIRADRKSTRLNSSHSGESRMPSSA